MKELQQQAAGHKSDMHDMATNQGAGRTEHSTLPTHAQHKERKRLRNEIATKIRNDLGMSTADAEWTKVRKEINMKMDTEIAMINVANNKLGDRLVLAEALIDQVTEKIKDKTTEESQHTKFEVAMTASRIKKIMQAKKKRLKRDQEEVKQMHDRLFKLKVQQIQTQGKNNILKKQINDLRATARIRNRQ
jgi:hypothetical protein